MTQTITDSLLERIHTKQAQIGVIGLGYVGLPLVLRFCEETFRVLGFDIDESKVEKLNCGETYIKHIPAPSIRWLRGSGLFEATSDYSRLPEADCLIICVPTPLDKNKGPDMSYIEKTSEEIARTL